MTATITRLPSSARFMVIVSRVHGCWCVETVDRATGENGFSEPCPTEGAAWEAAKALAHARGWLLHDWREAVR